MQYSKCSAATDSRQDLITATVHLRMKLWKYYPNWSTFAKVVKNSK